MSEYKNCNTIIAENNLNENIIKDETDPSQIKMGMAYLHRELTSKSYQPKDIAFTSNKLKELVGLPIDDMDKSEQNRRFIEKFKEAGIPLDEKKDINNKLEPWLEGNQNPQGRHKANSHDLILRICFAFHMDAIKAEEFVAKTFFERAFYRDVSDITAYYCLNNNISYSEWSTIKNRCENILAKSDDSRSSVSLSATNMLYEQLRSINDIEDLESFVSQYSSEIKGYHQMASAKKEIRILLEIANKIANQELKDMKNDEEENDVDLVGQYNALVDNQYRINNGETEREYNHYVMLNFPDRYTVNGILRKDNNTYDSVRKTLILLHFFVFFSKPENQQTPELSDEMVFEKYYSEANLLLVKCGLPKLWIMNPYEKIFLYCAHHKSPIQMLQGFVSDMFGIKPKDLNKPTKKRRKPSKNINVMFILSTIYGFDLKKRPEKSK